ncbi:MAG: 2,3,4,5-tetrahydropyridine-2,6-dicarboxylate N-succinyltransferase, partial [Candidatus Nanopelagicales bacterium]
MTTSAAGVGLATFSAGSILDVWYPRPALGVEPPPVPGLDAAARTDDVRGVEVRPVRTEITDLQSPPADVADAYLRLHLLSHRLVQPRSINLEGIFGLLPNVAWTTRGPVALDELSAARLRARTHGEHLVVLGVDRFPRMIDYVVPSGVRIADADRVRLG